MFDSELNSALIGVGGTVVGALIGVFATHFANRVNRKHQQLQRWDGVRLEKIERIASIVLSLEHQLDDIRQAAVDRRASDLAVLRKSAEGLVREIRVLCRFYAKRLLQHGIALEESMNFLFGESELLVTSADNAPTEAQMQEAAACARQLLGFAFNAAIHEAQSFVYPLDERHPIVKSYDLSKAEVNFTKDPFRDFTMEKPERWTAARSRGQTSA